LTDADGNAAGLYWLCHPEGMSLKQAFETQEHHGPFVSQAAVNESQRIELFGEQCTISDGGMWDPNWSKPQ
jgi:hypothetical protein